MYEGNIKHGFLGPLRNLESFWTDNSASLRSIVEINKASNQVSHSIYSVAIGRRFWVYLPEK